MFLHLFLDLESAARLVGFGDGGLLLLFDGTTNILGNGLVKLHRLVLLHWIDSKSRRHLIIRPYIHLYRRVTGLLDSPSINLPLLNRRVVNTAQNLHYFLVVAQVFRLIDSNIDVK